jgi:hypothetical protein
MTDFRVCAVIIVCAAVGGVGDFFASGLATAGGIAIGAGVGVAVAAPLRARRHGGQ